MNTAEKNYLLFVPSRLADNPKSICYKVEGEETEYAGKQTNEAVTKYLISYLHEKEMKLDKIIMLCTEEVMHEKLPVTGGHTTLEYYQEAICNFLNEDERFYEECKSTDTLFEIIPYSTANYEVDEIKTPLEKVIKITGDGEDAARKHLYVDFTGGPRSAALTLVFTCRILQISKVAVEKILYSNIIVSGPERIGKIEECTQVYNVFAMLEAKEAMEHGDNSKMMRHLEQSGNKDIKEKLENLDKKIANREMANQTSQIGRVFKESEGIVAEAGRIADVKNSVAAELILKGIENQLRDSRRIVENPQYKELINIEEFLEKKKYDKALSLFREKIVKIMIDFGVIKGGSNNNENVVTNEIMGAYCYYETPQECKSDKGSNAAKKTFLDAVQDYIKLLNENPEGNPVDILNEWSQEFYNLQEYMGRVPERGFAHTKYSYRICNGKIIPYLEADERMGSDVCKLIEQYQKMEHIYMSYGFPFACTYGSTWFFSEYEKIYKANIKQGAKSLQKYFQGIVDERMKRVLDCFQEEAFTYRTLIRALQKKHCREMLRTLFPFQLNSKNICSDVIESENWERFVYDFAQSFYYVKQVRNKFTHPNKLEEGDFKNAVQTVKRVILQVKKIKEESDNQGLRIDKISWANQSGKRQKGSGGR